jgi:hypothetical protein
MQRLLHICGARSGQTAVEQQHHIHAHLTGSETCTTTLIAMFRCPAAAAPDQRRDAPVLKQLAVGLAAAALLHSAPADAGVIIQKSSTKKVYL